MKRAITAIVIIAVSLGAAAPALAQYAPPPPPPTMYVPPPGYVPPPQQPQSSDDNGFRFKVGLGPTYRSLYGISFLGGNLDLALGGQSGKLAFYGGLESFFGATTFGLTTSRIAFAFTIEGVLGDRWRIGGGPRYGVLVIRRITNGSAIVDGSLGLGGHASVDLVRWGPRALFLQARLGADLFFVFSKNNPGTPVMVDIGASIGFRI